jgi:hypothetical protein
MVVGHLLVVTATSLLRSFDLHLGHFRLCAVIMSRATKAKYKSSGYINTIIALLEG